MSNHHDSMWAEASRDITAENTERAQAMSLVAVASVVPFLFGASSLPEYEQRLALQQERVSELLESVSPDPRVHTSALEAMKADFLTLHRARVEARLVQAAADAKTAALHQAAVRWEESEWSEGGFAAYEGGVEANVTISEDDDDSQDKWTWDVRATAEVSEWPELWSMGFAPTEQAAKAAAEKSLAAAVKSYKGSTGVDKFSTRHTASRALSEIADDIQSAWGKVNYGAVPYLDAMKSLNAITDRYYEDDARSIVLYFLSNASSFRGEQAKALKAELKSILAGKTASKTAAGGCTATDSHGGSCSYRKGHSSDMPHRFSGGDDDARYQKAVSDFKKEKSGKTAGQHNDGSGAFVVQVTGTGENTWSQNALSFDTQEEAKAYASDLLGRWFGADMARVVPTDTPRRAPVEPGDPAIVINYRTGSRRTAKSAHCNSCNATFKDTTTLGAERCKECGSSDVGRTTGSRHTANVYCPTHKVYVGDGNRAAHTECKTEKRKSKESAAQGTNFLHFCSACGKACELLLESPDGERLCGACMKKFYPDNESRVSLSCHRIAVAGTVRPLYEIAEEIRRCWRPVNYAAKPYLDAMECLNSIEDSYGLDGAKSIIAYFLSNARSFTGDDARRIKKELKGIMDSGGSWGGGSQASKTTAKDDGDKCWDCGGSGTVPSQGGEDADDVDNGQVKCSTCGGSGTLSKTGGRLPFAYESNMFTDLFLGGETSTGEYADPDCSVCHGRGTIDNPDGGRMKVNCPACAGSGMSMAASLDDITVEDIAEFQTMAAIGDPRDVSKMPPTYWEIRDNDRVIGRFADELSARYCQMQRGEWEGFGSTYENGVKTGPGIHMVECTRPLTRREEEDRERWHRSSLTASVEDWSGGWARQNQSINHDGGAEMWGTRIMPDGTEVRLYRGPHNHVRFYDSSGVQHGEEQGNVAPAFGYAESQGWHDPDSVRNHFGPIGGFDPNVGSRKTAFGDPDGTPYGAWGDHCPFCGNDWKDEHDPDCLRVFNPARAADMEAAARDYQRQERLHGEGSLKTSAVACRKCASGSTPDGADCGYCDGAGSLDATTAMIKAADGWEQGITAEAFKTASEIDDLCDPPDHPCTTCGGSGVVSGDDDDDDDDDLLMGTCPDCGGSGMWFFTSHEGSKVEAVRWRMNAAEKALASKGTKVEWRNVAQWLPGTVDSDMQFERDGLAYIWVINNKGTRTVGSGDRVRAYANSIRAVSGDKTAVNTDADGTDRYQKTKHPSTTPWADADEWDKGQASQEELDTGRANGVGHVTADVGALRARLQGLVGKPVKINFTADWGVSDAAGVLSMADGNASITSTSGTVVSVPVHNVLSAEATGFYEGDPWAGAHDREPSILDMIGQGIGGGLVPSGATGSRHQANPYSGNNPYSSDGPGNPKTPNQHAPTEKVHPNGRGDGYDPEAFPHDPDKDRSRVGPVDRDSDTINISNGPEKAISTASRRYNSAPALTPRQAKVAKIAAGVGASNPGMNQDACIKVAEATLRRFAGVVSR